MPKSRPKAVAAEPEKDPVERARDAADALFRAATECCHQHDRASRIHAKSALDDEIREAQRVCEACDEALRERTGEYERTAADVHPTGGDEGWWHRANALWLASREYLRRNGGCDAASRELKEHSKARLGKLHTEFELEASALLALRHAASAYRQDRPTAA